MKELTGLADILVSNGEMEAYQYTLEKIQCMIQELQSKAVDVLDMFSNEAPTCSSRGFHQKIYLANYLSLIFIKIGDIALSKTVCKFLDKFRPALLTRILY